VLERLSARTDAEDRPTRWSIVTEFCRLTNWRDRKGALGVGSANLALRTLEAQGLVRLPPPSGRGVGPRARRLKDDGQPLAPAPRMPAKVERVPQLRLHLVSGEEDPLHWVWNRLICREHPLGAAPLVGSQLRYLILCGEGSTEEAGVVGAVGLGPAAYHLECRDGWIGWDAVARQANRPRVIGLSRFLIRPGVRCAHLASRCYRLVLSRVAGDWQARYGWEPVLVETYVDRHTRSGVSLAAANWRRLGQSSGRGRSSAAAQVRPHGPKDVWVHELRGRAREILQQRPIEAVVPRSIFRGWESSSGWEEQEMDSLALGHRRLERRWVKLLAARWRKPGRSFGASFPRRAEAKAAYRLVQNPRASLRFESLLAPHHHQTQRRMAAEAVVVLAQDTTTLSYNTLEQTHGLGPVGESAKPGRGLFLHSLHAFRPDRIPLGCAWAHLWARPPESDTQERDEQSVADKESGRWLEAYQAATRLARSMPRTHLVVCADREGDVFELFDQSEVAPANLHLLVRAQHDRGLTTGRKLWEELSLQPLGGTLEVEVPRRKGCPARRATLELKWTSIQIAPPRVALKKSWSPLRLYVVMARETAPPPGVEPIEWVLLTDWKVDSLKMARRLVRWYALRWGIECWHQVLKDSYGVEERQLKSASALERALVLDMIVAWRALLLCRLAKQTSTLSASPYYTAEELKVLEVYRPELPAWASLPATLIAPGNDPGQEASASTATPCAPAHAADGASAPAPPEPGALTSSLTLLQANLLVAMLGGFWGRRGDGTPGPKTLSRGLLILSELVRYSRMSAASPHRPPHKPPSRKPG
jgi:hypothetical protein